MERQGKIVIYQSPGGQAPIDVKLENETVWSTVAKNATVQTGGDREVIREIEYYNLDTTLSVGYRVNSKGGYAILH